MLATDILKVIYAPQKIFKKIVQEPKYLAALIVFILFVAVQVGYYYSLYSKINYEQTGPNMNQLGIWTLNTTMWQGSPGISVSSNYNDFIDNPYYGNSSLQFTLTNSSSLAVATKENAIGMVNCSSDGFQNMSLRIRIVQPNVVPETATLTLYSLTDANYFQYDLTPELSNASQIGLWNNLTVPVGHGDWQTAGSPQWSNITAVKLDLTFPSTSEITIRMEGLFFRGIYESPVQTDFTGFLIYVLQLVITQFLFEWLILTGLLYILIKGLKGNTTWKPLFVAVGIALIVTVVQGLINIASSATLPALNYPVELWAQVSGESLAIYNSVIAPATATFTTVTTAVQLATYAWIVGLDAIIVKALVPEFSWSKSLLAAVASFVVTVILLGLLGV